MYYNKYDSYEVRTQHNNSTTKSRIRRIGIFNFLQRYSLSSAVTVLISSARRLDTIVYQQTVCGSGVTESYMTYIIDNIVIYHSLWTVMSLMTSYILYNQLNCLKHCYKLF
jgi:hypothetical protein